MLTTVLIGITSLLGGAALGFFLCGGVDKRLRQRIRTLRSGKENSKMTVSNKVLIIILTFLIIYSIVAIFVFWHVGSEMSTLTTCIFSLCSFETGMLGWIKTTKVKQSAEVQEQPDQPEPPVEREEPPDVGV